MLDPGIKNEDGYFVYDNGEVWPRPCVFPDFTKSEACSWWASLVKDFVINGADGSWNDMNEPAVTKTEVKTMLESKIHRGDPQHGGKQNHSHYHNVLLGPEIFYKHFNFTHEIDMPSVIYALERLFLILYQAIYKSQASFFFVVAKMKKEILFSRSWPSEYHLSGSRSSIGIAMYDFVYRGFESFSFCAFTSWGKIYSL
ncbi:alpha-glucosidase 2 [Olea europaea subsp. europaea]|uniref:Alpha-glucosidase 2 n=1 Tax=Olea europaea subsp. europaea TaxID=158383 RepID=A0A8S0S723_OLEEU|nr:alpha-glucosidase 2 [Olea europaea subsp. europaea]